MNTNFDLQILSSTSITTLFTIGCNFASCRVAHLLQLLPSAAADLLCNNLVTALVTLPVTSCSAISALQCILSLAHSLPALLDFLSRAI
jgi:hypothetical protein